MIECLKSPGQLADELVALGAPKEMWGMIAQTIRGYGAAREACAVAETTASRAAARRESTEAQRRVFDLVRGNDPDLTKAYHLVSPLADFIKQRQLFDRWGKSFQINGLVIGEGE